MRWRNYSRRSGPFLVERSLDRGLKSRFDASDVVQQTLLDATKAIGNLANTTDRGLLAWLRNALQHDMDDLIRKHVAAKMRTVHGEKSLDASVPEGGHLRDTLDAGCSTPSRHAMREEDKNALHRALAKIPPAQADAVRMRHLQNMPLKEIANPMNRSTGAVSLLLVRGIKALRAELGDRL